MPTAPLRIARPVSEVRQSPQMDETIHGLGELMGVGGGRRRAASAPGRRLGGAGPGADRATRRLQAQ